MGGQHVLSIYVLPSTYAQGIRGERAQEITKKCSERHVGHVRNLEEGGEFPEGVKCGQARGE